MPSKNTFKVGDKVKLSAAFLRSLGESATGQGWHSKGTITDLTPFGGPGCMLATVEWNSEWPNKIITANLSPIRQPEPFV
jgi:hypothetical protein